MPSATDLITYIGIPLTVLGLLPVFWNIWLSFYIRYKLSASIPLSLRPCYDLIANPANGDVIVSTVTTFNCENPGLWPESTSHPRMPFRLRFQRWRHKAFYSLTSEMGRWPSATRPMYDFEAQRDHRKREELPAALREKDFLIPFLIPKTFDKTEPRLLFRSWMSMFTEIGFSLNEINEIQEHRETLKDLSYTVNVNMKVQTQNLEMPWWSFVWFSLAVGVHPLDIDLDQREWKLKYAAYSDGIILLSKDNGDWHIALDSGTRLKFSIRQALAWDNVMCFDHKGSIMCRSLGKWITGNQESNRNIDIHGQGKLCRDYFDLRLWPYNSLPDYFLIGPEDGDDHDPNEHYTTRRCRRHLAAAITWIFYLEGVEEFEYPRKTFISQGILEAQEKSLCALYQSEVDRTLKEELVNMLSRPSDTQSTTKSFQSIDDMMSTQDLVDLIHKFLLVEFQLSSYLRETNKVLESLRSVLCQVKDSSPDCFAIAERLDELLASTGSKQLTRLPQDISEQSTLMENADRVVLRQLRAHPLFSLLIKTFNPHMNIEQPVEEQDFPSPSQESELFAHILLVLQDWRDVPRVFWERSREFRCLIADCCDYIKAEDPQVEHIIVCLKEMMKFAKKGVYEASGEGVIQPLLNDEKFPPKVYFV